MRLDLTAKFAKFFNHVVFINRKVRKAVCISFANFAVNFFLSFQNLKLETIKT